MSDADYYPWAEHDHCDECRWARQIPEKYQLHIQKEHAAQSKKEKALKQTMYGDKYIMCMHDHAVHLEGWCCGAFDAVDDDETIETPLHIDESVL